MLSPHIRVQSQQVLNSITNIQQQNTESQGSLKIKRQSLSSKGDYVNNENFNNINIIQNLKLSQDKSKQVIDSFQQKQMMIKQKQNTPKSSQQNMLCKNILSNINNGLKQQQLLKKNENKSKTFLKKEVQENLKRVKSPDSFNRSPINIEIDFKPFDSAGSLQRNSIRQNIQTCFSPKINDFSAIQSQDYDFLKSLDCVCVNHPTKKAKYFTIQNESSNHFYCSKCAVDIAGRGIKINQIRQEIQQSQQVSLESPQKQQIRREIDEFMQKLKDFSPDVTNCYNHMQIKKQNIQKYYQQQEQIVSNAFDSFIEVLQEKKNIALKQIQIYQKNMDENYINYENVMDKHMNELVTMQMDIENNTENIIKNVEYNAFKQIISKYKDKLADLKALLQIVQNEQITVYKVQNPKIQEKVQNFQNEYLPLFKYYQFVTSVIKQNKHLSQRENDHNDSNLSVYQERKKSQNNISFENKEMFQQSIQQKTPQNFVIDNLNSLQSPPVNKSAPKSTRSTSQSDNKKYLDIINKVNSNQQLMNSRYSTMSNENLTAEDDSSDMITIDDQQKTATFFHQRNKSKDIKHNEQFCQFINSKLEDEHFTTKSPNHYQKNLFSSPQFKDEQFN